MSGTLGKETFTFKSSSSSFTIRNQTFCLVNDFNDKITPSNYHFDVIIIIRFLSLKLKFKTEI